MTKDLSLRMHVRLFVQKWREIVTCQYMRMHIRLFVQKWRETDMFPIKCIKLKSLTPDNSWLLKVHIGCLGEIYIGFSIDY